jgi:carbon monoxide dehydrogenase subunit G
LRVKYEGQFRVERDPASVFRYLTDPNRFSKAFPGFQGVEVIGENEFKIDLTLKLGPVSGKGSVRGRIVEAREGSYVKIRGNSRGAGSTLDYTLEFRLRGEAGGSVVSWRFEGIVVGLAASMGGRILDNLARRLITDMAEGLKRGIMEEA